MITRSAGHVGAAAVAQEVAIPGEAATPETVIPGEAVTPETVIPGEAVTPEAVIPDSPPAEDERPMRADARRNRERILEAARELFGEDGAETQMDDVARRAGVGVGTVYRHFPTKEALMGELVRQKFALFVVLARDAVAADAEPFEALADLMRRNAEHLARDAATRYAMGEGTAVWEAANVERDELRQLSAELIARGHRAGTLRQDVTVADIPMLMCGIATSIDRGFDWRRHLELVVDTIRAAPPDASAVAALSRVDRHGSRPAGP